VRAILYFDIFTATFLFFLGYSGFKRGFVVEIGRMIGMIFTLWVSITYYVDFAEILQKEISINPLAILYICFFIIFSLTFILTRVIVYLIDQAIGIRKTHLINQLIGFVFGVLKGMIPIAILLWALEILPAQKWVDSLFESSKIARTVRYVRDTSVDLFRWNDPIDDAKDYLGSMIDREKSKTKDTGRNGKDLAGDNL
jgi:membrane protein required for colicin V production